MRVPHVLQEKIKCHSSTKVILVSSLLIQEKKVYFSSLKYCKRVTFIPYLLIDAKTGALIIAVFVYKLCNII